MGDGITILNQTEIMATPQWLEIATLVTAIAVVIPVLCVLMSIINEEDLLYKIFMDTTIISAVLFISSLITGSVIHIPTGKYIYNVTVNEDVSLTDFYEKYEVVEVNGKIWTIQEK